MNKSSNNRPAVIAALHQEIDAANPSMPGVRGRNKIAEATSALLAHAGLLSLQPRLPGQKQPKATNLDELCRITDRDLRKLVPQWECMENVRAVLLQQTEPSDNPDQRTVDASDITALCTAIIEAIQSGAVRDDQVPSLQQLSSFAIKFLTERGQARLRKCRTKRNKQSRKHTRARHKRARKHGSKR